MGFQTGGFAGFWLGGQCPLAAWGEENFENLTMKWCILKYIYVVRTALFSRPACPDCSQMFRKLLLFCMFRFLIFHPFFQGGQLAPFAPMCGRPWFLRLRVWLEFSTDGAWRQNGPENLLVIPEDLYCVTRLQGSKKTRTAVGTSFRDGNGNGNGKCRFI